MCKYNSGDTLYVDYETDGKTPYKGGIVSMQILQNDEMSPTYVDIMDKAKMQYYKDALSEALAAPDIKIVAQNTEYEFEWTYEDMGVEITNMECTMRLAFVLDRGVPFEYTGSAEIDNPRKLKSVGLKAMARHYLAEPAEEDAIIDSLGTKKSGKKPAYPGIVRLIDYVFMGKQFDEVFGRSRRKIALSHGLDNMATAYTLFKKYAINDPLYTRGMWRLLRSHANNRAYRGLITAIPHLARMKRRGLLTNKALMLELKKEYEESAAAAMKKVFAIAGKEFNIQSTAKELPEVLQAVGIPLTKTDKGKWATNKNALAAHKAHPFIVALNEYRLASKRLSTYTDNLINEIDENDVVHPRYNVCGAVHGRYSSGEEKE